MEGVRVIKRYANRKMYDTKESRYVSLTEFYEYLQDGVKVAVIDNRTKKDITIPTLLNVLAGKGKDIDKSSLLTMLDFVTKYIKGDTNG